MTELRVPIVPKLLPFATERRRHKIARGGRGSGKSWSIARLLVAQGTARRQRWLCAREVQKSIKESSHRLIADTIEALGLGRLWDVQRDVIKGPHGSEFAFAGLQDHTADSIKSYEGFDGCWVEEAHTVSERSAQILIPTIRTPGSEIWWSYNPDQAEDFVHQTAEKPDENTLVVTVNWNDNPWFPPELDLERRKLKAINEDLYQHVWEGKCRSIAGLMFKRHWFKRYDALPELLNVYLASDYAVTEDGGDYTEHGLWGIDPAGDLYAIDWWYGQTDPETWLDAAFAMIERRRPLAWFEEKGVILRAVDAAVSRRMRERNRWVNRVALASAGNKASRALGFAARASAGTVWLPKDQPWADRLLNQLCAFNGEDGRVDDGVDVCSLLARGLDQMIDPTPDVPEPKKEPVQPFTPEWLEYVEREDAMTADEAQRYLT